MIDDRYIYVHMCVWGGGGEGEQNIMLVFSLL